MWRKTILATAIVGAGLASTTGAAFASDNGHDTGTSHGQQQRGAGDDCSHGVAASNGGDTHQTGLLNVDDVQTTVPTNFCQNNIPVNAAGVQVPVQDSSLNLPVLSGTEGGGNSAQS